jgi:phosphoribosyl-AMP cyclohydrolase
VNELEEGTALAIDFEKIHRAARSKEGLVPVVLQHAETRDVLFVGYANDRALAESLATGRAVLWSASRDELWRKGATSGDELELIEVRVNCEQNALLYLVRPLAGVCHTRDAAGATRRTCFYRRLGPAGALEFLTGFAPTPASPAP